MLDEGVVLGHHADRDEGLIVAEGKPDYRVEALVKSGKLVIRLCQTESPPFKIRNVFTDIGQRSFVERDG